MGTAVDSEAFPGGREGQQHLRCPNLLDVLDDTGAANYFGPPSPAVLRELRGRRHSGSGVVRVSKGSGKWRRDG